MYLLRKSFTFDAAHWIPCHEGKCKNLHGHTWRLDVILYAHALQEAGPESGMVCDYGRIKEFVQPIIEQYLDHQCLNDTVGGFIPVVTSETLAKWLYEQVKPLIPQLRAIEVWETPTSSCRYEE